MSTAIVPCLLFCTYLFSRVHTNNKFPDILPDQFIGSFMDDSDGNTSLYPLMEEEDPITWGVIKMVDVSWNVSEILPWILT